MTSLKDWEKLACENSTEIRLLGQENTLLEMANAAMAKRLKKHDDLLREICDNISIPHDYRMQIKERMNG